MQSQWLKRRLLDAGKAVPAGTPLLGMSPTQFRRLWRQAVAAVGLPDFFTPYSLRRGGATSPFQHCGSFDTVADAGRWLSAQSCRTYISSALAQLVDCPEHLQSQLLDKYIAFLT